MSDLDDKFSQPERDSLISSLPSNLRGLTIEIEPPLRLGFTGAKNSNERKLVFLVGGDSGAGSHITFDIRIYPTGGFVECHVSDEEKKRNGEPYWTSIMRLDFDPSGFGAETVERAFREEGELWLARLPKMAVARSALAVPELLVMPIVGRVAEELLLPGAVPVRKRRATVGLEHLSDSLKAMLAGRRHSELATADWELAQVYRLQPATKTLRLWAVAIAIPAEQLSQTAILIRMDCLYCLVSRYWELMLSSGLVKDRGDVVRKMLFDWSARENLMQGMGFLEDHIVELDREFPCGRADVAVTHSGSVTIYAIRYAPSVGDVESLVAQRTASGAGAGVLVVPLERLKDVAIQGAAVAAAIEVLGFDPRAIPGAK